MRVRERMIVLVLAVALLAALGVALAACGGPTPSTTASSSGASAVPSTSPARAVAPLTDGSSTTGQAASASQSATASQLPGISSGPAPWPAETDHLQNRLAAIGLPALTAEGTVLHTHEHVDIFVHGEQVPVPANAGIHDAAPLFLAPIHTHDDTGIVHVESPTGQKYYLGQFFDIWGVVFSSTSIGGYASDAADSLSVYVNGILNQGDPRNVELTEHEEIAVIYGTAAETPQPVPSSYAFPPGY
jgi:hypothetical protein